MNVTKNSFSLNKVQATKAVIVLDNSEVKKGS